MSRRSAPQRAGAARRPANTRRANEAARGARARRRRLIAMGVAGALVAAIIATVAVLASSKSTSAPTTRSTGVGALAPNGSFTTASGHQATIGSLRGHPTLVWFVTTWCSSCQAGTQALAGEIGHLASSGVRVVELELADDLGQAGPSITAFARQYAGAASANPDWTWGVASSRLTATYDPADELEIYYLLDTSERITYVNSPLVSTMSGLLGAVARLTADSHS
ncbi:MAG: redoxin domain-containing protein [Actinomycetota bacterium]|nr:redoxin domain-containing protein [Actinomycetota bacterium]